MSAHAKLGTGSPVGVLVPDVYGQHYIDTVTNNLWQAYALTNAYWVQIAGVGAGSYYYRHDQVGALATWTVNHNLGSNPNVSVYSTGGLEILAEILHVSINQTQIIFDSAKAGYAIFS